MHHASRGAWAFKKGSNSSAEIPAAIEITTKNPLQCQVSSTFASGQPTVSHDSHNIVVIGRSAEEMALAVNQVIQDGGGLCVVRNGQVQSHLPLPIAGLMSTDTAQSLAEQIDALKAAARECGPLPDEPFIQMAFLSLPVIPALKLTSQGLFDGEKFAFTTLEVTE